MALTQLTKIDGRGINTTSDYRVGILTAIKFVGPFDGTGGNFAGVVTATDGVFSGNVTIGGTLTYEDVTNIDSVGIITARDGIHVGAGVSAVGVGTFGSLDIGGDIDVDGHTNLDNVSIAGVSTFSGDVKIDAGTSTTLTVEADSAGVAMVKATGGSGAQATAAFELVQSTTSVQGGGISYNGDGSPAFASGETQDATTFYRIQSGTRYEVFSYPYNSNTVTFNGDLYGQRFHGPVTGNLTGTVITAAQSNITSLGTLTGLSVSGTTSPVSFTHTGGNCVTFNRNSKTLAINANYAGNDAYANIIMTSGMDIRWTLGGADRINFKSAGHIEPHTDSQINLGADAKRFANVYADTLYGDGSNLTGIVSDKIFEGNTEVETVDTGSNGYIKLTTEGTERLRIKGDGVFQFNGTNSADNTNKLVYITSPSYDTDEEPFCLIHSGTYNNQNLIYLGGGMPGSYNACTLMKFYTTPSVNTLTGTERLCIESWGGIQNNQGSIYGGGVANEPTVHFNGAGPSNDPSRGHLAVSHSAAYNSSPIARISLATRYNSSGGYTFMGGIEAGKANTTDGNYDGFVRLMVRRNGQNNVEGLRINANGDVTTTGQLSFNRQNAGFTARSGDSVSITRASGTPLEINRTGSDGQMIGLLDDNNYEAAIGLSSGSLVFGLPNVSTPRLTITSGGNVNIGGDYTQTTYTMKVTGSFAATTKSFVIDHPTKENHSLRYACLEGPENSVYVRGKTSDSVIELPDYWKGLVHEDSITVNVTPIGNHKVWVEAINNNSVTIGSDGSEYFYTVFAERKDVDKLEVEVAK